MATHRKFIAKAITTSEKGNSGDERLQQAHSIEEFDAALQTTKNKLVVVIFAASHSKHNRKLYHFIVDLSRRCNDVEFILVMGDESDKTKSLCERENIVKAPHLSFYKNMEKVHEEEGIIVNHSAVIQLHSRKDVENLIEQHRNDNKLIVLDVGLKHCGPCVKIYPTFLMLSRQMVDTIVFARMDGAENDSCVRFLKDMGVVEVPTFLFIKDGDVCGRYVGSGKVKLMVKYLDTKRIEVTSINIRKA
ncbi:hypothetical protein MKW98_007955 [Papaver atlanticum]|uniref:Thioredoxin domain-containing protein n=1 Tax=Papaver atlanticum TaxID=357466 RepID=A0AAD4X8E3_9MAGN|nr:hypothetical protein MKW98_007955 [Papaver atlanticum]